MFNDLFIQCHIFPLFKIIQNIPFSFMFKLDFKSHVFSVDPLRADAMSCINIVFTLSDMHTKDFLST